MTTATKKRSGIMEILSVAITYASFSNQISSGFLKFQIVKNLDIASYLFALYAFKQILSALISVPVGLVSDKFGHKKILIISQFTGLLSLAMLLSNNKSLIIASFFLSTLINSASDGKIEASIYNILDKKNKVDQYKKCTSLYYFLSDMLQALIVYSGIKLFNKYSSGKIIICQLLLTIISMTLCHIFIEENYFHHKKQKLYTLKNLKQAILSTTSNKNLLFAILVFIILQFTISAGLKTVNVILSTSSNSNEPQALFRSLAFLVFSLGSLLSFIFGNKNKVNVSLITLTATCFLILLSNILKIGSFQLEMLPGISAVDVFSFLILSLLYCSIEVSIMEHIDKAVSATIRRSFMSVVLTASALINLTYNYLVFTLKDMFAYQSILKTLIALSASMMLFFSLLALKGIENLTNKI